MLDPEPGEHRADRRQRQATRPTGPTSSSRRSTPTRSSSARFYKPTPEDIRVQTVYDTAQVFTKGAQELNDAGQDARRDAGQAQTAAQQQEIVAARSGNILAVTERLGQTSQLLAER